jgi:hypothetical protein
MYITKKGKLSLVICLCMQQGIVNTPYLDFRDSHLSSCHELLCAGLSPEDAAELVRAAWTSAIACNFSASPSFMASSFKVCPPGLLYGLP